MVVERKRYLGDAVMAELDQFGDLVLTTDDSNAHRIVLDLRALEQLVEFLLEHEVLKVNLEKPPSP